MKHLTRSHARERSGVRSSPWHFRLAAPLVLVALGCRDVTPPVAHYTSAVTGTSHAKLPVTELASLAAAADDARTRLVAPLAGTPGGAALSEALARLASALIAGDARAARQTLPAIDAALTGLTSAFPSAAPDLDAVRLAVDQAARALSERAASLAP